MKHIPERKDLRTLQLQLNAIYEHLEVQPIYHATTTEIGFILIKKEKQSCLDAEEASVIKKSFSKS